MINHPTDLTPSVMPQERDTLDYLAFCKAISSRLDLLAKWISRYQKVSQSCYVRLRTLNQQYCDYLDADRGDEECEQLRIEIEQVKVRLDRCQRRLDVLFRYARYVGQLPFRVLKNERFPDRYWYAPA